MESKKSSSPGYELRDLRPRGILIAGVALLLLCGAVTVVVRCLFDGLEDRARGSESPRHILADEGHEPRGPRLQADPPEDRRRHQTQIEAALHAYGWIDPQAGRVSLPVERALELVLEEGLPQYPGPGDVEGSPGEDR